MGAKIRLASMAGILYKSLLPQASYLAPFAAFTPHLLHGQVGYKTIRRHVEGTQCDFTGPEGMQQSEKPTPVTAHVCQKRKQEASEEKELENRLCMTFSASVPARPTRRDREGSTIRRLHILHLVNFISGLLIRMYPIPHHRRISPLLHFQINRFPISSHDHSSSPQNPPQKPPPRNPPKRKDRASASKKRTTPTPPPLNPNSPLQLPHRPPHNLLPHTQHLTPHLLNPLQLPHLPQSRHRALTRHELSNACSLKTDVGVFATWMGSCAGGEEGGFAG